MKGVQEEKGGILIIVFWEGEILDGREKPRSEEEEFWMLSFGVTD